jgi:hypothetical protein
MEGNFVRLMKLQYLEIPVSGLFQSASVCVAVGDDVLVCMMHDCQTDTWIKLAPIRFSIT